MSLAARPNTPDYTVATLDLRDVLKTLQAQLSGFPVAETAAEKQSLLQAHAVHLQQLQQRIEVFTAAGLALPPEVVQAQRGGTQAILHPYLMQAPFARRSFEKPLGYAGDYVMVRHIVGDPFAGESAFAQLVNYALVQADVALGHRNRIDVLEALLSKHAQRGAELGRKVKVLTIGCGPAEETHRVVQNSPYADYLDITLLDFSEETLAWTEARLAATAEAAGRAPTLRYVHESVYNLAKKSPHEVVPEFDVVICAGLFDYLTDRFCKRVIEFGMRSLTAGGALMVTNVSRCASSFSMSELLEWDLIYRSGPHLASLIPASAEFPFTVEVDRTGTNVFAHVARTVVSNQAAPEAVAA